MTEDNLTTVEKTVMLVTGALFVIAMPVIGLLVTLTGSMSAMVVYAEGDSTAYALSEAAVPEGAEIVASPLIGPNARALMIAVALVLLGLLAVYKLVQPGGEPTETTIPESTQN